MPLACRVWQDVPRKCLFQSGFSGNLLKNASSALDLGETVREFPFPAGSRRKEAGNFLFLLAPRQKCPGNPFSAQVSSQSSLEKSFPARSRVKAPKKIPFLPGFSRKYREKFFFRAKIRRQCAE